MAYVNFTTEGKIVGVDLYVHDRTKIYFIWRGVG